MQALNDVLRSILAGSIGIGRAAPIFLATLCATLVSVPTMARVAPLAYIANSPYDQVKVVDTATMTIVGAPIPVGHVPVAVAVSPDARSAYVLNFNDNSLSVIDTQTNTVIGSEISLAPAGADVAVSPDSSTVYVSVINAIAVVTAANREVRFVPVCAGGEPNGIAVTPDGSRLYVGCAVGSAGAETGAMEVVDTAALKVIGQRIPVGIIPDGAAVTPDNKHLYVANQLTNTITAISVASNSVEAVIPVDEGPEGIAISPDSQFVYVTSTVTDTVSVVSVASNTVVPPSIPVGTAPVGIAITPDGKKLLTINYGDANVSVVDIATRTVTSISGFNGPHTLGKFIAAASTTMSLQSNPNPSVYGQSVALTATVVGGTPAGLTSFTDDNVVSIESASLDTNGEAVLSTSLLSAGTHTLTANFPGNAYSLAATASTTQVVSKAPTTTTITRATVAAVGVSTVVSVSASNSAGAPPTGNVVVSDGKGESCTFGLPEAACTLQVSSAGTSVLTAVYGGDSNYEGSSGTFSLIVGLPQTLAQAPALGGIANAVLGVLIIFGAMHVLYFKFRVS